MAKMRPCSILFTLLELDPDPSVILNLLDHLAIPANDDANSKSRHNHLC